VAIFLHLHWQRWPHWKDLNVGRLKAAEKLSNPGYMPALSSIFISLFVRTRKAMRPLSLWNRVQRLRRRVSGGSIKGPRTLAENIRFFANPGPRFESASGLDGNHLESRATTVAFYLPQFHAFEENDAWWGEGFTEWRNVSRGMPRYRGHYQPRIPRDLGHYDLSDIETIRAQCELAQRNGIDAFCFYYYWFNGKRLMEKPLDLFLESDIDQPFCIMWANENWTRTWDGLDEDVLIKQDYLDSDEDAFIADTSRHMADPRYLCVGDQPLFILYRPGLLPDAKATLERWREKWAAALGRTPLIMMVQGFGEEDPRKFGLDGAVEFPPHKVCAGLNNINDRCQLLDKRYDGLVRDYADVVEKSLGETAPEFPLIKTVSPHWDNDARRQGQGMTLQGSTPALYERWLNGAIDYAVDNPVNDESLVFVNAWNEWAEGAYLEPDVHYGHAYLNATQRATKGLPVATELETLLLVGHDAHRHGAQMLLLNMARMYRRQFGMNVIVALKEGGTLLPEYQKVARTVVLKKSGKGSLAWLLRNNPVRHAICNTSVTGDLVLPLRQAGVQVVSLIHELPHLIRDFKLESRVEQIASKANHVVFPAETVRDGFLEFAPQISANAVLRPQGTYHAIEFDADERYAIRDSLGIEQKHKVVLGVGYADLRKGFDLFMETARRVVRQDESIHFVWAGALSADMKRWFKNDFGQEALSEQIHLIGFTDKVRSFYSAADCLYLPSREDPYPTVVLEAMNIGLPVVMYEGTTGFDSLMRTHGYKVPFGDSGAIDAAIATAVNEKDNSIAAARAEYVETECAFDDYCFDLLQLLNPALKRISVVVPNYNYAEYLEQRLTSIFAQQHPVYELIFMDDGSSDGSEGIARRTARQADRSLRIVTSSENSGSVFKQWRLAAEIARGEVLWIAEADDDAQVDFLQKLMPSFNNETTMVFSDSSQIGMFGEHLSKSYAHYVSSVDAILFRNNFSMSGRDFVERALSVKNTVLNVSAVLLSREKLLAAMSSLGAEINEHDLVGDWRLYIELLLQDKSEVAYVAEALNVHRRHDGSVTHLLSAEQHIREVEALHTLLIERLGGDEQLQLSMDDYIAELSKHFGLPEKSSARAA